MIRSCRDFRRIAGPLAHAVAVVLALVLVTGSALAEPAFSFDTAPGKLPKTVVPIHYAVDLALNPENRTIVGFVLIDIEVREPTTRIVLNADDIAITAASIDDGAQRAAVRLDDDAETATLTFPRPLTVGAHRLRIAFTGKINTSGPGLYVAEYPTDKGVKRLISGHLAPADARRVFPCWDEPAFKATFALTVTVPRSFTAVSNMPVAHEQLLNAGAKKVTFLPTPKMSSYLVQLTVGELERVSAEADGVIVSVITTAGKSAQGRFALDSAVELLRYFNDYFDLPYPLPKLDLIAVPHGYVSAMEHWGAITFQESRLLFEPGASAGTARRSIFALIAHELAHQWFGNLVTMGWWNNLWLNEGFATWMEAKATEHFHPQWQIWLNNNDEKQSAMSLDARDAAHPIQQPIADESEAYAIFDNITYNKAAAIVRMLEAYMGEDAFRTGLRRYLAEHAYGNTTSADLWQALAAASGKPIAAIAMGFIEQRGVPLVVSETICHAGEQRLRLRQERFSLSSRAGTETGAPRHWQVPVAFGTLRAPQRAETVLLQEAPQDVAAGRCGDPVKLNIGDVGYYRVEYDVAGHAALAKSFTLMSPADRVNMLTDAWALAEAGRASPAAYFDLLDAVGSDDSRVVWEHVIGTLRRLDQLALDRAERARFQVYARARLRPVLDRLGWDDARPDADGAGPLRARLIRTLGELGDERVIDEAKRRFAAFLGNPTAVRPGLRDAVLRVAGMAADRTTYSTLVSLARKATSSSERERFWVAAAGARDPALAQDILNVTLTGELPTRLVETVINTVASDGGHPDLAWTFVKRNFVVLMVRHGTSFRDSFVANLFKNFSERARAAELASFAPAHATSGGRAVAARAVESIEFDADFKARALPEIDEWIKRRNGRD